MKKPGLLVVSIVVYTFHCPYYVVMAVDNVDQ